MVEQYEFDVICNFCGKARKGITITDDGYDWEGHHRGHEKSETRIKKCSCEFGKLENSMPKIKPMCRNCRHYDGKCCTNSKKIEELKTSLGNFDIKVGLFLIKNPDLSCDKHELDYRIFDVLFKE